MADRRLTGILLVGGASTRFGSPKALARIGDETLAERLWRVLGEACEERLAVGKAGELELPFDVLDDGADVRAPIAGLVAACSATSARRSSSTMSANNVLADLESPTSSLNRFSLSKNSSGGTPLFGGALPTSHGAASTAVFHATSSTVSGSPEGSDSSGLTESR